MGKKKRTKNEEEADVPIESMIDIIFLLIIFFVVTAAMDKDIQDERVKLATAPHGKPLKKKDPRSVYINVRDDGNINMNGQVIPMQRMSKILANAASENGTNIPIVIRGDLNVDHEYIKKVMNAVTSTGLYRVKFNAVIEGEKGK
jgi:biopolymer transport protein ExbD